MYLCIEYSIVYVDMFSTLVNLLRQGTSLVPQSHRPSSLLSLTAWPHSHLWSIAGTCYHPHEGTYLCNDNPCVHLQGSKDYSSIFNMFQRPEHWSVQNVQVWAWAKNLDIDSGIDIAPLGVLTFLLTRLGVVKENIRLRLSLPYNYIGGKPIWSGCSTCFRV